MVAHGSTLAIQLVDCLFEPFKCCIIVECSRDKSDSLGQLCPDILVELGTCVFLDRVVNDLHEVLVVPIASGEPDEREAGRQQATIGEVIDGGHEFLTRQVAGHAKDDETRGSGYPIEAVVRLNSGVISTGDMQLL